MMDCLVAAHAVRAGIPVLHADVDFDALAHHTALRLDGASAAERIRSTGAGFPRAEDGGERRRPET